MEQRIPPKKSLYTVEEYLRMEEASDTRHEFRNGKIISMAGGSYNHSLISSNINGELRNRLKGKPCTALSSELHVRITGTPNHCYPDVTVICGPPVFDPPDSTRIITNPQVIFEVGSPSTERDDRDDKFDDYMRIDSLKEYILVAQDRPRLRTFYRHTDGIWAIGPSSTGLETSVTFRSLGITLPLAEIYANVKFPDAAEKAE